MPFAWDAFPVHENNAVSRSKIIKLCYEVPGQMWPTELGWLYDELKDSKFHAEIGTYCGRSLLASCSGMRNAKVVAVDNFSDWSAPQWVESVLQATLQLVPSTVSVSLLKCMSIDAARHCYAMQQKFDSVFIDACHEYAECKADIEAWSPLVKPGGLLCGHDYWTAHVGVMDAVNEALAGKFNVFSGTRIWYTRL